MPGEKQKNAYVQMQGNSERGQAKGAGNTGANEKEIIFPLS
jgi:hypothetical protein